MISAWRAIEKKDWPSVVHVVGHEPYVEAQLRKSVRSRGYQVRCEDLSKDGLSVEQLDDALSVSLFEPKRALWLKFSHALSSWKAEPKRRFQKLIESASQDGALFLVLQSSEEWKNTPAADVWTLKMEVPERQRWIQKMSDDRGLGWSAAQINRLESTGLELYFFENWAEQCLLGGSSFLASLESVLPPAEDDSKAFRWVEALLTGHTRQAQELWKQLMEESEAIPLVALAAKSLRITVGLSLGFEAPGEPPFLIQKARTALQKTNRARLGRQLEALAKMDLMLKTSSVDENALFALVSQP